MAHQFTVNRADLWLIYSLVMGLCIQIYDYQLLPHGGNYSAVLLYIPMAMDNLL